MATTIFSPQLTRTPQPTAVRETTNAAVAADLVDADQDARPNYVAIYTSSMLAMTALFFIGVAAPCAIFLDSWKIGVGVGAMFAFWGGPSFGTMLGAARVATWFETNQVEM